MNLHITLDWCAYAEVVTRTTNQDSKGIKNLKKTNKQNDGWMDSQKNEATNLVNYENSLRGEST